MTDLETRLRTLRVDAHEGASPAELRRRATARARRRRRRMIAATALVVVATTAAGAVVMLTRDEPSGQITTGPGTTPEPGTSPNRVIGDVDGVHVDVSPRTDLLDGDLVDVRIDGLENLPDAGIVQCAGDVTEDEAVTLCDLSGSAVQAADGGRVPSPATQVPVATEQQTVSIARTIHITRGVSEDLNSPEPYDCATEEAGCVLVVGPLELPVRAVAVPLTFSDVPQQAPTAEITPDAGLQDGGEMTVVAEGLRPNGTFRVQICETAPGENCDEHAASTATSDADGILTATVTARAAIYGYWGRTDCTTAQCAVVVRVEAGMRRVEVPLTFDEGVTAPVPALQLEPSGPYSDGQDVTVLGSGFPPGVEISGELRQCPTDIEPGDEGLCIGSGGGAGGKVVIGPSGAFRATTRVWETLPPTGHSCAAEPGCVFGWVIPNGPLVASIPLEFENAGESD